MRVQKGNDDARIQHQLPIVAVRRFAARTCRVYRPEHGPLGSKAGVAHGPFTVAAVGRWKFFGIEAPALAALAAARRTRLKESRRKGIREVSQRIAHEFTHGYRRGPVA